MKITICVLMLLSFAACDYTIVDEAYLKKPTAIISNENTDFTGPAKSIYLSNSETGDIAIVAWQKNITKNNLFVQDIRNFKTKNLPTKKLSFNSTITANVHFYNDSINSISLTREGLYSQIKIYSASLSLGIQNSISTIFNETGSLLTNPASLIINDQRLLIFSIISPNRNIVRYQTLDNSTLRILTKNYSGSGLSVAWGESLSSDEFVTSWKTAPTTVILQKINITDGSVGKEVQISGYNPNFTCTAYATDKKRYGLTCLDSKSNMQTLSLYCNHDKNGSLELMHSYVNDTSTLIKIFSHKKYLVYIFKTDTTYSYEMWNPQTRKQKIERTTFLTSTVTTNVLLYQTKDRDIYTLLFDNDPLNKPNPISNMSLGLLL